jgi:hypothetical protein
MKQDKAPRKTVNSFHDVPKPLEESTFDEVVKLIQNARQKAFTAANKALIDLYWQVGEYISRKLQTAEWGEGVVDQLAGYIATHYPDIRGFTRPNLFRMRQFYETYRYDEKVSPLVRQLPWTHNLLHSSDKKLLQAKLHEFYTLNEEKRGIQ